MPKVLRNSFTEKLYRTVLIHSKNINRKYNLPFLMGICLLCFKVALTQNPADNYVIEHLSTRQGLSHNYVTSIISDDLNLKWIGTENGITEYDGLSFEYVKPGKNYTEMLNENIEVLFKDRDGQIWIGTKSGGISYFDTKKNRILNFNSLIDPNQKGDIRIISIAQDEAGNIWAGSWSDGLFVFSPEKKELLFHFDSYQPIYSIKKDFNGNMWYALNQTLYKYIPAENISHSYPFKGFISDILPDNYRNKVWIATSGNKNSLLFGYNFNSNQIDTIETGVYSNFTKKLMLDHLHRLWIGTWNYGVYMSDIDLTRFERVKLNTNESSSFNANYSTVLDIHEDKNKIIWLATANGGVVKLIEGNGFLNAEDFIANRELEGSLNITSIYKTDKNIFVGTVFNGLYYGSDFSHLKQITEIGNTRVKTLYAYAQKLYISANDEVYVFDLIKEKIIFKTNKIVKATAFHVDESDNLYVGTQQDGLVIIPQKKLENYNSYKFYNENSAKNKIESNRITSIKEDHNGNIWIATYNGLHLYDQKTERFIHQSAMLFEKIPSVIINSIEINGNFIWLATPGGLFKLKYQNHKLHIENSLTKEDGLNSDFICAITFDSGANLWFSTHTEIVRYNQASKTLVSYGEINGVKTTSFNNSSFFNFNQEEIYFGGVDNITFFKPQNIKELDVESPDVVFTNIRVNNKPINYTDQNTVIDNAISYAKKITLDYQSNSLTIGFVANDFGGNLSTKYRYFIGEESDKPYWIDLQNQNEINFSKLPPDNYTLQIQASRNGQDWGKPKLISISIAQSPWKTPWAYGLYILTLSSLVFYFFKLYKDKIRVENNLKIKRIEIEKERELNESKLTFFTNISHEFRTPLTLILSPLNDLMEQKGLSPKHLKNLSFIEKNANKLLNLVNQLLDFRKAEYGSLLLSVSEGNIVRFCNEVFLYFKESAREKNINFNFSANTEEIFLAFDRSKMEIVLSNLISNAIKFTDQGGSIQLEIKKNQNRCKISVSDTGIGIEDKHLKKIFDRFYQISSAKSARMIGSGIGLAFSKKIVDLHKGKITVNSKVGKGTKFTIKLPLNASFSEQETNLAFLHTDNIDAYPVLSNNNSLNPAISLQTQAKQTILVIDDNKDILQLINNIIQEEYNVITAENGIQGHKIATEKIPDLIVSDVMMPEKDGISLCKDLKSDISTSHIPVILLTARTSTVYEIEGLKTGAEDYITKPFNANVLKAKIASLLVNREKMRMHLLNKIRFQPQLPSSDASTDHNEMFIDEAVALVEKNIDNPEFNVEELAEKLNMSKSSLYRKLKSLTGISIVAFVRSLRLKKAAQLILQGELNLNQVAFEVGFNDYKYFKTCFKEQFKCLPSEYKVKFSQKE